MTIATIENPVKLQAEGIRLLNAGLGPRRAQMFLNQCLDGIGDYLAEKKMRSAWTDAEVDEAMDFAAANANSELWRGGDFPTV
jgi:hypothetical protein